jgi:glyoxylase-like metal-dependent hydrolase (beta-lactamase superfamily II)
MTYTGEVEVGGPADVQSAGDLRITKLAVGEMSNNAYLLRCELTGEQVLVDAAAEPDRLLELVGDAGLARIVTTHRHHDHWGAEGIDVASDRTVATGARVRVGSCELEVIEVVGHTPGSIVLAYDDPDGVVHLFVGDDLFPGGVGKTWTSEDFTTLIGEVETKLFDRFPDDTHVYPGHGAPPPAGVARARLVNGRARGSR